jgi:hypothetical protein
MCDQHPFIVLDQNVMRDRNALASSLNRCCRENLHLLIPDVAGFELSKGSRPLDTWCRSLALLVSYPELVVVSRKLTDMLYEEGCDGIPCRSVVHDDLTAVMREILGSVGRGDNSLLSEIVDRWPPTAAIWSDSEQHKKWIKGLRDGLRSMIGGNALSKLRNSPEQEVTRWLSSVDGVRFVFQGIKSRGIADKASLLLSSVSSITAAFVAAFAATGLYWLAFGGLENASPNTSTNDLLDTEYAILGSLSVDLLSSDKRISMICRAMKASSRERHNWIRSWFRSGRHGI